MSYLKERLTSLNLTDADIQVTVKHPEYPPRLEPCFTSDSKDNIEIHYFDLDSERCVYTSKDGKELPFKRKRYKEPKDGQRYSQPFNSPVFTYLTPSIIAKYQAKTAIDTLYIIEGEFKAFSAHKNGLDCIGIAGIQMYKEKATNELDTFIKNVIVECKVKNVVLLFDADCMSVKYEPEKDLYTRPNLFYSAVRNFKELLKPFNVDVYFSHILEKFISIAKGFDDLINLLETDKEKLLNELAKFATGKKREYINCLSISENSITQLRKYFGIESVNTFYDKYKNLIGDNEFIYNGNKYRYDESAGKLKISWYGKASQYKRIGITFYKRIMKINVHGETEEYLQEWNAGEINRDFNNNRDFINQIPKYDLFVNIPDNNKETFKQVHIVEKYGFTSVLYNRYYKLDHDLKEGNFDNITKFLKHIFSACNLKGESLYEFGLDYLQLLYTDPVQRLPVLCLVSSERNTGKSTFLLFLKAVFNENMTIVDNHRFGGQFTSHYITKLIIAIDEAFIDTNKEKKEHMKHLVTDPYHHLEAKGRNAQQIETYCKLILCSNDENNFVQIDDGENRFAVLKVPVLQSDDVKILQKMKSEIPYFLHFLKNRKLNYERDISRFSFNTSIYMTEQMNNVIQKTKPRLEKAVHGFLQDEFLKFEKDELSYTAQDLTEAINESVKQKFDHATVMDYLKYSLKLKPTINATRYKRYVLINSEMHEKGYTIEERNNIGRVYTFHSQNWIND